MSTLVTSRRFTFYRVLSEADHSWTENHSPTVTHTSALANWTQNSAYVQGVRKSEHLYNV